VISTATRVKNDPRDAAARLQLLRRFDFGQREAARHTAIDGVTYKIAEYREEREAAFRLIYDAYTQSGLMKPNPTRMRVTPYHLLPTTDIFLAVRDGEVLCTLTLIGDGELGNPMESIYGDEVQSLRDKGLYFGELSCLADRRQPGPETLRILTNLDGLISQYARHNGMDLLLIAVHPKHEAFYRRLFGYKHIGKLRSYPSVGDRPAVAAAHDFARMDIERYPMYDQVYRTRYSPWELLPRPMLEDDRDYFRDAADMCGAYIPMAAA
jgi:hypothetical protein